MTNNPKPDGSQKPKRNYFTLVHIAGVVTVIATYIAIFSITGDSDLFYAIGSGIGVWLIVWLLAIARWHRK